MSRDTEIVKDAKEPSYLKVEEVAELLRMHPQSVRRAIQRGDLPGVKVAGSIRISRDELEKYLHR